MATVERKAPAIPRRLSTPETCCALGITERTLVRWVAKGLLKKIYVGQRRVAYDAADVEHIVTHGLAPVMGRPPGSGNAKRRRA